MAAPSLTTSARTTTIYTTPAAYPVSVGETLFPLPVDFSGRLASGETVASATASLTDVRTGQSVPAALSGSCSVSGAVATQTVVGAALSIGRRYKYACIATLSTSLRTEEAVTILQAVA